MASNLHFHWESGSSASEESQGEDIQGVEYAARSVDGSKSGRSLESFLNDEDSASIQGPNFYRALTNENSLSPAQLPKDLEKSKKSRAPGFSPTSPFPWTSGSAFKKGFSTPPPCIRKVAPSCRPLVEQQHGSVGKRLSGEASLEEDLGPMILTGQALDRKRRRIIFSQDSEERHLLLSPRLHFQRKWALESDSQRVLLDATRSRQLSTSKPRYIDCSTVHST
ncbi:hypothetical protein KFL_009670010 [Klebsormidium nitens]|uniref:Uncharacterized protein n=1 Tax=Klebsormidium nitens TaxID=105231 RepID=A0A1Y1ITY4_KLENI|nr:hypothetical protein KFL_009670010 [Klebsormidium nitens]|eukprot:GAQ92286.1 hypothetical protein KFL_009670010 [Klebsormidium nitens]